MGNLARSIEANWDPMGSKLSCDGTPLDDEDAGKSPLSNYQVLFFSTSLHFQVSTVQVTGQLLGPISAKRKN